MFRFIIIASFVLGFSSLGVASDAEKETSSVLHLDKSFYVTGEVVWYKLYTPDFLNAEQIVIQTAIVDHNANMVLSHFNRIEGSGISGYFKLPFDLKTSMYKMVFLIAEKGGNSTSTIGSTMIPIYNDLESPKNVSDDQFVKEAPVDLSDDIKVSINFDKDQYQTRENINLEFEAVDANNSPLKGTLSVSVRDYDLSSTNMPTVVRGDDLTDYMNKTYLNEPFLIGSYYKGDNEIVPKEVLGVYSRNDDQLYLTVPNSEGEFLVKFPDFYGSKSMQFFPYIEDKKNLKINLESIGDPFSPDVAYTEEVKEYINWSKKRKKLFQRQSTLESKLDIAEVENERPEYKVDKEYVVSEYKLFENLASFFTEVKTPVRGKYKDGKYITNMYMLTNWKSYSEYSEGTPIYMVDGYLTRDSEMIGKLELDLIDKLQMMYDPKTIKKAYRLFGSDGIVKITTNSNKILIPKDDQEDIFTIAGLLPETVYPVFSPKAGQSNEAPFFRPQLFWDADIEINKGGSGKTSFYQSDDVSTFIVEVVFRSEDGRVARSSRTYNSIWQ